LSLGARNLTEKNDRYFKGTIREMAVFNRTLTAEEIAAIHAAYVKGQSLSAPAATPAAAPKTP
jgi:cytidine deaminase